MTDTDDIEARIDAVEQVIEQLEAGGLSVAEATEKYEEAMDEIEALREDLAVGEGNITETNPDGPTSDPNS